MRHVRRFFSYRCSFNVFFCIFIISVYDAQKTKVLQTSPSTMFVKTRNWATEPTHCGAQVCFLSWSNKHSNFARNFRIEMPHLIQNQHELIKLATRPPPPFLLLLLLTLAQAASAAGAPLKPTGQTILTPTTHKKIFMFMFRLDWSC